MLGAAGGSSVASRPATLREWAWIGAAVLWLLVTLGQSGGLATQMLHAWALFVTGAFVVLMLPGRPVAGFGSAARHGVRFRCGDCVGMVPGEPLA